MAELTATRSDGRLALVISFSITLAAGSAFIFWRWAGRGDAVDGLLRCVTFAAAMVAVHVWGFAAYRRQAGRAAASPTEPIAGWLGRVRTTVRDFNRQVSIPFVLAQQGIALLCASAILDGGTLLYLCLATIGAYWASVLVILIARVRPLTKVDAALAAIGFWPLLLAVWYGAAFVWRLKGIG
jgi:hypothetical protein